MKISDIRAFTVTVPLHAALRHANGCHWGRFVRTVIEVEADNGLVGLGEMGGGGESAEAAIRALKSYLVGHDPVRLEEIAAGTFHHARTRNYAAELAKGKFLVYLAADAFPVAEDWLSTLLGNFEDHLVGAVYGRHLPKPGSSFEREDALGAVYGEERLVKEPATREQLGYRYYHMSTVNAAIRRDVWAATKFPEELKVFEDLGIVARVVAAGGRYPPQRVYRDDGSYEDSPIMLNRACSTFMAVGRTRLRGARTVTFALRGPFARRRPGAGPAANIARFASRRRLLPWTSSCSSRPR